MLHLALIPVLYYITFHPRSITMHVNVVVVNEQTDSSEELHKKLFVKSSGIALEESLNVMYISSGRFVGAQIIVVI